MCGWEGVERRGRGKRVLEWEGVCVWQGVNRAAGGREGWSVCLDRHVQREVRDPKGTDQVGLRD